MKPKLLKAIISPALVTPALVTPALVTLCALLAVVLSLLPLFHTLEQKTVDWRIRFRAPDPSFGKEILVVLLDEPLMEQLPYRSPVPRGVLAGLIELISESGAELLALDVFLKNPTWEDEDRKLISAMRKSGKVVIVSALRAEGERTRLDLPHEKFLDAALAAGLSDLPIDPVDQRVRDLQITYEMGGRIIPAFSTALFALHTGAAVQDSKQVDLDRFSEKVSRALLDGNHRMRIDFQGPPSSADAKENVIRALPASAVLTGLIPREWFRNKIVLIGAGYEDNTDAYRTPFYSARFGYPLTPGVEIHANALATLMRGKTVTSPRLYSSLWVILVFSLSLLLIERRFDLLVSGAALMIMLAGYTVVSFLVFERTNLALPIVSFSIAMVFTFLLAAVYRSLTEGRQKRWIKNAFQMYLSPDFVNILLKKPDMLFLGGVEKDLTVLFSDLQGFTSLSEGMAPTELVALLNEYLDGMTRILLAHGGTLDKYEGDAIMAFWGAPLDQEDHAGRAVSAALEMSRFSDSLSLKFQQTGRPGIKTRIGLNTGRAVVGNIGSERRFNYTLIGDEVNLASRLEGANKHYGTFLMISQSTFEKVKTEFLTRELDLLRVKGKERPVKVYEVIGFKGDGINGSPAKMLDLYSQGLSAYGERSWSKALGLFQDALSNLPEDGPSLTYLERCRHFMENPPGEDWDGVFTLKTK
ncbi:MAG: adenylate/guanylate cyclase domain-containing protein [Pseudomonadota bacterium]